MKKEVKASTKAATPKKSSAAKSTTKKPAVKKTAKKKTTTKKKSTAKPKPVIEKIITPTQAELMCRNVDPRIKGQAIALANAVITLQNKIIQQTPEYESAPLTQEVIVGTGEKVLRSNPLVQEYRATVRDYAAAMKSLDEIINAKKSVNEVNPLDALRNKIG